MFAKANEMERIRCSVEVGGPVAGVTDSGSDGMSRGKLSGTPGLFAI